MRYNNNNRLIIHLKEKRHLPNRPKIPLLSIRPEWINVSLRDRLPSEPSASRHRTKGEGLFSTGYSRPHPSPAKASFRKLASSYPSGRWRPAGVEGTRERGRNEGAWKERGGEGEDAAIAGSDSGGGGVRVDADTAVGQGSISYPSGYGRRDPPTCSSTPRRASVRRRLIWG